MLYKNKRWFEPITFKTNVVFAIVVTLFLALTGWLMQTEILPSLVETSLSQRYSPWNNFVPLRIWMQIAVISSLIMPVFVLLECWHKAIVRPPKAAVRTQPKSIRLSNPDAEAAGANYLATNSTR